MTDRYIIKPESPYTAMGEKGKNKRKEQSMSVGLRGQPKVYSVKYVPAGGGMEQIVDIVADGMSDVADKFKQQYPGAQIVNSWRAS